MGASAALRIPQARLDRADLTQSIFVVVGPTSIAIRAGTVYSDGQLRHAFEEDRPVTFADSQPGTDYRVFLDAVGAPSAIPYDGAGLDDPVGGFHFAPAGNAAAREGGTPGAAINPFSCWDIGFRPACQDPRGMALVDGKFWADIYLLGVGHPEGTSRFGVPIADGVDLPLRADKGGHHNKLDYDTAVEIYKHHGKQLLGAEEFFAAAYGVKERCSRGKEPTTTGSLDQDGIRFVSRHGLLDVTGTMWQWGTDGDPDNPRASIFGGSWLGGDTSGSRCAPLVYWPEFSGDDVSARGRCDHLKPA